MKKWAVNICVLWQQVMRERYCVDELSAFLSIVALVMILVSLIPGLRFFYPAAMAPLVFVLVHSFSKKTGKRQEERNDFLDVKYKAEQKTAVSEKVAGSQDSSVLPMSLLRRNRSNQKTR